MIRLSLTRRQKDDQGPRTLDYSKRRTWGHDITYTPDGHTLTGSLWHPIPPRAGDWLVLSHPAGGTALYRMTEVRSYRDPDDMFGFAAVFVPGSTAPESIPEDDCGRAGLDRALRMEAEYERREIERLTRG